MGTLHPSFAEPLRSKYFLVYCRYNYLINSLAFVCFFKTVVDRAPFEVTEFGWGEFEAGIRIIFKDKSEQPIDIAHHLKLYPPLTDKPAPMSKKVGKQQQKNLFCNYIHIIYMSMLYFLAVYFTSV